jgi:lipopolysaccharide biosynthesis protein
MKFDYKYYIDTYQDLKHFNYDDAYNHWLNYGIKEGRSCCVEPNVVIMIHLFYENLYREFLGYIDNVKAVFKSVKVIITLPIHSNFEKVINEKHPDFIILKVENKGVDIFPFITSFQYVKNNNIKCDYVLKMHTKISSNIAENFINWREDLIKPITKINNLYMLKHYFTQYKNIGYVGSQKCVLPKEFDLDFPQNIEGINAVCSKFTHLEKNWTDFNGGNIFWISYQTLLENLTDDLAEYFIQNFLYGKPPDNLADKGTYVEYLCERIFTGVFCYNKLNILVNEYNGHPRGMGKTNGIINNSYFYQPSVFNLYSPKNVIP